MVLSKVNTKAQIQFTLVSRHTVPTVLVLLFFSWCLGKNVRDDFCTGILHFRNPNSGPNSGKQILDTRILDPHSWVEFFDPVFPTKTNDPYVNVLEGITSSEPAVREDAPSVAALPDHVGVATSSIIMTGTGEPPADIPLPEVTDVSVPPTESVAKPSETPSNRERGNRALVIVL